MTTLAEQWGWPEESALAGLLARRQRAELPTQDFITAHPQDHGYCFNPALLQNILGAAGAQSYRYSACALGRPGARKAVAAYHGGGANPGNVLITPGTSMGYYYLFRLLARTHGEVLCPAPTYPLFSDIAQLAGLRVRHYHLRKIDGVGGTTRWVADPDEVAFQLTAHTVAIVVVSPHNPTGTIMSAEEMAEVCRLANGPKVPVIFDEVFRGFALDAGANIPRPAECGARLSVTLNGLSKSHHLPGLKAGWMVVEGEESAVRPLVNALEYISDTFLPVNELVQAALPELLAGGALAEADRLSALQRAAVMGRLAASGAPRPDKPESGPYLCIPLPQGANPAAVAAALLAQHGAYFHPGDLYGFAADDPCLVATAYNQAPWPAAPAWRKNSLQPGL